MKTRTPFIAVAVVFAAAITPACGSSDTNPEQPVAGSGGSAAQDGGGFGGDSSVGGTGAVAGSSGKGGEGGSGAKGGTAGAAGNAGTAGSAGTLDGGPSPLSFSTCTLLTDPTKPPVGPAYDGIASAMAECATMKAPAVWDEPNGDQIDVFVKRYPAVQQPAKGQLWILNGGPGNAGSDFESGVFLIAKAVPTLDIYLPDHRGTGKSAFASCSPAWPSTPDQAAACAAAIPHLDGLTATGAAKDLAALIDATRGPSQQVFVYSISYGTYWAQRYLQIRPDQPTAVVLDSTVPAVGMDFSLFDKDYDDNAHAVLDLCKADTTCSAKLGPDPLAKASEAISAVEGGACVFPGKISPIRLYFGMVLGTSYFPRLLLPASIYRILRCNQADRAWFWKVEAYLTAPSVPPQFGISDAVYNNIVFSEFWLTSATYADLAAQQQTMLAIAGSAGLALLVPSWPKYPHDAYYGSWPSSPAPTLVLQGTLDPNTPFGDAVKPHYSGQNQYFVEFPNGGHGLIGNSPMVDPNAPSCGWQVMLSFLADQSKPPDTSCIAGMAPLDFGNPPAWWLAQVGIQDLWENPVDAGIDAAGDAPSD